MPKIEPFEKFSQAYEAWFEKHSNLYDVGIKANEERIQNLGETVPVPFCVP